MTPKEKAMEIAMKFDEKGETDNAIQCALICVDEILNNRGIPFYFESCFEFWKEVKQELNKLLL